MWRAGADRPLYISILPHRYWHASGDARAFTFGRDAVFAAGHDDPESERGRHLRAHELTHSRFYFTGGEETGGRNDLLGNIHSGKTLRSFGVNPGGHVGFFDPATGKRETFARRGIRYQRFSASGKVSGVIRSRDTTTTRKRRSLCCRSYKPCWARA